MANRDFRANAKAEKSIRCRNATLQRRSSELDALERPGFKGCGDGIKIVGAWNVVAYTVIAGDLEQRNLRACRTWADMHLSSLAKTGKTAELENVLKSVTLQRD
ncbi:MAG: hypothetical protein ABIV50_06995 [Opitutus sp.]